MLTCPPQMLDVGNWVTVSMGFELETRQEPPGARAGWVQVLRADYTQLHLPAIPARTAFVGNPPYVRHHRLSADHGPDCS